MSIHPNSQLHIYQTEGGQTRLEVRLEDETVWLSQKMMTELFQKDVRTISEHIQNIFDENELLAEATIRKFRIVQTEDKFHQQRLQMEAQQANEQDFDLLATQIEKQHKKQDK